MAEPMYRKIAQDLREQIESGLIAPGEQLPTELVLRDRYGASRNTVRDAVKWLMTRGLVETRPGQGTFAVKRLEPFVTTLTADPESGLGGGEGGSALS
jgi:GntR family transcriptional regulator